MKNLLPLNSLNAFNQAATHLSFLKASQELYVTASAISHQVRNLESILGYKLFERLDKKIKLTVQGESLFAEIAAPFKQIQKASQNAQMTRESKRLALSVAPVFATGWLLPRLEQFYNSYPEINLSVVASTQVSDFSSDPFDASIRLGTGGWENVSSYRLFNQEIVAVCHPDLVSKNGGLLTADLLVEQSLIQNSSMRDQWKEWFQFTGVAAPDRKFNILEVEGSAQVIEALQLKNSVGLLDRQFILQNLEAGRLAIASEHVLKSNRGYYLTFPERHENLHSLQCFKEWLFEQLANTDS